MTAWRGMNKLPTSLATRNKSLSAVNARCPSPFTWLDWKRVEAKKKKRQRQDAIPSIRQRFPSPLSGYRAPCSRPELLLIDGPGRSDAAVYCKSSDFNNFSTHTLPFLIFIPDSLFNPDISICADFDIHNSYNALPATSLALTLHAILPISLVFAQARSWRPTSAPALRRIVHWLIP